MNNFGIMPFVIFLSEQGQKQALTRQTELIMNLVELTKSIHFAVAVKTCVHGRSGPLTTMLEHIKLPAKLLDYFLRSNKSNINQW